MSAFMPDEVAETFAVAISETGVGRLLADGPAIVLERIARGGGATRWYWLRSTDELGRLCRRLGPGSVVSFYFDRRIQRATLDDDVAGQILDLVAQHGDVVVGLMSEDDLEIVVDLVAGPNELSELGSKIRAGEPVFFGVFPARDNDGLGAVTLTLPDADGVVREHPH